MSHFFFVFLQLSVSQKRKLLSRSVEISIIDFAPFPTFICASRFEKKKENEENWRLLPR